MRTDLIVMGIILVGISAAVLVGAQQQLFTISVTGNTAGQPVHVEWKVDAAAGAVISCPTFKADISLLNPSGAVIVQRTGVLATGMTPDYFVIVAVDFTPSAAGTYNINYKGYCNNVQFAQESKAFTVNAAAPSCASTGQSCGYSPSAPSCCAGLTCQNFGCYSPTTPAPTPSCGDGACNGQETYSTCPIDCPSTAPVVECTSGQVLLNCVSGNLVKSQCSNGFWANLTTNCEAGCSNNTCLTLNHSNDTMPVNESNISVDCGKVKTIENTTHSGVLDESTCKYVISEKNWTDQETVVAGVRNMYAVIAAISGIAGVVFILIGGGIIKK